MIGETIKQIRQRKGYSISKLAKTADVSKSYLSEIERGIQTNPSLQFLKKISISLDTSLEGLLEYTEPASTNGGLDEEWIRLLTQAIKDGLNKEDFQTCRNCMKYKNCLRKHKSKDSLKDS